MKTPAIEALRRPLGKEGRLHQRCGNCGSVLRPHRLRCPVCGEALKGDGTVKVNVESEEEK